MTDYADLCDQAKRALRHKDVLEAVDLYEEAVELNPDGVEAHEGLATACYLAQEYAGAIEHFVRVTLLKPRDARAYVNLGAIYNLQGEYRKAVDSLRKAVQRDSKNAEAFYNLGIAEKNLNQNSMAISAYQSATRLDPEMVEAHINLANLYAEQNNTRKAKEHYEAALKADPECQKAQRGLDLVLGRKAATQIDENPFGRLVDTSKLVEKGSDESAGREFTEDERFEDRQFLQLNAAESVNQATALLAILEEQLEPALLETNRLMALDVDNRQGLFDTRERLHEALIAANEFFDRWQQGRQQLKDHEAGLKG
ncbi:MAG: tetratricopeptide repeat protein [Planctomycetota bacterium]|jgi:tetratricopeptide (TPR) repeat protein